jgi:hypothetical protein
MEAERVHKRRLSETQNAKAQRKYGFGLKKQLNIIEQKLDALLLLSVASDRIPQDHIFDQPPEKSHETSCVNLPLARVAGAGGRHQGRFAPAVPVACGDP